MLVLALQFSRSRRAAMPSEPAGDRGGRTELEAARWGVKDRIPQNGREDGARRSSSHEEGPNPSTRARVARRTHQCTNRCVVLPDQTSCWSSADEALLRKEVIQPHLPVRLPCYDFTPITDPTFDGSLPEGLGHRLRVLPTFVV